MVGYLVIQSFFSSFGVALIWFTIAVYSHYMYNWIDEQTDDRQRQQRNSPSTFYSRERMYIFSIYLHLFLCMFYYLCTTSSVKYSFLSCFVLLLYRNSLHFKFLFLQLSVRRPCVCPHCLSVVDYLHQSSVGPRQTLRRIVSCTVYIHTYLSVFHSHPVYE